ncbi:thermonuclease family protein [Candidatus Pacearchaeota archaeon]|nr:thermonuclease family protein [Candidatus Pacearchaeota archaeon]
MSVFITILTASNVYLFSNIGESGRERVAVERVIDGDTFVTDEGATVRMLNINTPEKNVKGYEEAKEFLAKFENKSLELEILGEEKYGRSLARVYSPEYINLKIVELGLATKFLVDESEKEIFAEAEREAIENGLGIWEHSRFFGCFYSEIDPEEEVVLIKSSCGEINFKDWVVKDESRKEYKFRDIIFDEVNLNTESGEDERNNLFWGSSQNVWNNNRDSFYLFDSERRIAHYEFYGY